MNRTIKEATVKRYYYQSHDHLKRHLHAFLMAYNIAKRLKALKGLTSYEYISKIWTKEPERFNVDPFQHNAGLNMLTIKLQQFHKQPFDIADAVSNRYRREVARNGALIRLRWQISRVARRCSIKERLLIRRFRLAQIASFDHCSASTAMASARRSSFFLLTT